jgi:hypothetical protein
MHKIVETSRCIGHVSVMPSRTLLEAIALRKCITARYNRGTVKLAPHILYTRHDELFIDAVTVERDGQPPREAKLGTFKLAGLTELALDERSFETFGEFDIAAPRYAGATLFAVEVETAQ